ncbi:uncharacterized protein [Battus philenor]|uniref:uncharacterized protein n=1 Tax=Battus philenor TaxID=42288 RepID=UPI0035D116FE
MTTRKFFIIFLFFVISLSHSAFIDTLLKCSIFDNDCQKKLYQESLSKIGKTGIPELNIPPIDPFHLQDVSVSVLNLVNLTIIDGIAKGAKNCVFTKYSIDIEKGKGHNVVVCDIVIKGKYRLRASSPVLESVLGGSEISGEGKGKVKLDKLKLEFVYSVNAVRKDDGEIYLNFDYDITKQKFDILGKVSFAAENIYLGKQDVSDIAVQYVNNNWKLVTESFGQSFINKAFELCIGYFKNFLENVPAKDYIIEDLTSYLN